MTYPQQQYPPQGYYPPQPGPAQQYPPQQPAPVLYPQQPAAPQGYYPQAPQGYAPQQAPQVPPPQLAKGSLKSFSSQPNGSFGKALKFDVVGRWYLCRIARPLNDGDSRQRTDPQTRTPVWNSDGTAAEQLCLPVIITPGTSPEHPTGAATLYIQSKNQREELTRAMTEAGLSDLTHVQGGDVIYIAYTGQRSSGMGSPAKIYDIRYTPAAQVDQVWGAQAPPLAPVEQQVQQPVQPVVPPQAAMQAQVQQGYYLPPPVMGPQQAPAQPQPAVPAQPVAQAPMAPPVPQAAPQPPAPPQPPAVPPQPAAGAPGSPPLATPEMQARMNALAGMTGTPEAQQG